VVRRRRTFVVTLTDYCDDAGRDDRCSPSHPPRRQERAGSWVDDNAKPDPNSRKHADAAGDAFVSAGSGVSGFISDTIEPEAISLAGSPPLASSCL